MASTLETASAAMMSTPVSLNDAGDLEGAEIALIVPKVGVAHLSLALGGKGRFGGGGGLR